MSPALEALRRAAAALGDRTRMRLLLELSAGPRRVGELVAAVGVSQPLVSHHLAVLSATGWVVKAGAGKRSAYELAQSSGEPLRSLQALFSAVSAPGATSTTLPTVRVMAVLSDEEPMRTPGELEDFLL